MVKNIVFFKRKPGMSVEDFRNYWLTTHADIVVKMPGILRYVQSHTLLSGYRKGEPVYDGTAELWFDDTQAMRNLGDTPAYEAVQADEHNFIDLSTMGSIITEEHIILDGPVPADGVKSVGFVTHNPRMSIDEFQQYWLEVHGPLAAVLPPLRRAVQCHTRRGIYQSGRTPVYDGVALTWFDDTQAMRLSAATPEFVRLQADERNFLAPGPTPIIITKEHVIVG